MERAPVSKLQTDFFGCKSSVKGVNQDMHKKGNVPKNKKTNREETFSTMF